MRDHMATNRALKQVYEERVRQDRMKAEGRFRFTCADTGPGSMTGAERLTVLAEEVGEVAREVLTGGAHRLASDTRGTSAALRAELAQVAAVAVAWMESLSDA